MSSALYFRLPEIEAIILAGRAKYYADIFVFKVVGSVSKVYHKVSIFL